MHSRALKLAPAVVAGLALVVISAMVLLLAGRPVATADLWFHLAMGETYLTQGLWPQADPLLHTAGEYTPVQHEWLFGALVYGIERAAGLHGLRVAHVLAVAGILWLAFSALRRQAAGAAEACLATVMFCVLSWQRLMQARPDLVSIAFTLILYRLLLEPGRRPGRGAIAGACVLLLLWANFHSLFAIGLALVGVAMVGAWFRARLATEVGAPSPGGASKRLAVALALGLLITLLNPRGVGQHLTFFTSSTTTAVWAVGDEWHAFSPLWPEPPFNSFTLPWLSWLVGDLVIVVLLAAVIVGYRRLKRERSAEALAAFDPALLLLGIVCTGAFLVSFRFLWLGIFPLLFALRVHRPKQGRAAPWAAAALAVATVAAYPSAGQWAVHLSDTPTDPATYLGTPANRARYAGEGVAFLAETGVEGRLFNNYTVGGYAGYHLAPAVRTFIDGRAEHYPPEVMIDYDVITAGGVRSDGRHFLDVLDDRGVDLFFGVGGPGYGYHADDTLHHLEAVPWWMLVYRSAGHGIWLRRAPRNVENLDRIAAWYEARGLPFDRERGLDVGRIIREHTGWAVEQRLVPPEYPVQRETARTGSEAERAQALMWLGQAHETAGDYPGAIAAYGEVLKLRPQAVVAAEAMIRSMLGLGAIDPARAVLAQAREHGLAPKKADGLAQRIDAVAAWRAELAAWNR